MSLTELLSVIILCATIKETMGFDYCEIKGCEPKTHTMCKYPRGKPDCKVDTRGLNRDQRITLLRVHNEMRQKVAQGKQGNQPPAADMMKMVWNNEVEDIAQRWAERCKVAHDPCRSLKDDSAGQNAAGMTLNIKTSNQTNVVAQSTQMWYDEVEFMNPYAVKKFDNSAGVGGKVVGHYTQLVSAKSTQLGCGYIEKQLYSETNRDIVLICNYSPAGNLIGAPIYKEGTACSDCPEGSKCSVRYPGLCTSEADENNDVPERDGASRLQSFTCLVGAFVLHAVFKASN